MPARKITVAAFVLLALTAPAFAEDLNSGNYILNGCHMFSQGAFNGVDAVTNFEGWECVGVIEGILFMGTRDRSICPPEHVPVSQGTKVVFKYMDDHPDKLNLPFASLIFDALASVWPCH